MLGPRKEMCTKSASSYNLLIDADLSFAKKWFYCDTTNGQNLEELTARPSQRHRAREKQHDGWNVTWLTQRVARFNVIGPFHGGATPPRLGLASLTGVCEPWRIHPTLTPLRQLSVAHSNAVTWIERYAKLTRLIRHNSGKGWNVSWRSCGYLPLKTMAAEAPITPKKGEYSGLSSEDILALFSGWYDYGADCVPFFRCFPCASAWDRLQHWRGATT